MLFRSAGVTLPFLVIGLSATAKCFRCFTVVVMTNWIFGISERLDNHAFPVVSSFLA